MQRLRRLRPPSVQAEIKFIGSCLNGPACSTNHGQRSAAERMRSITFNDSCWEMEAPLAMASRYCRPGLSGVLSIVPCVDALVA